MWTIIIFGIIGLVIGICMSYSDDKCWDKDLLFLYSALSTFTLMLVGFLVAISIMPETRTIKKTYGIETLKDNNTTKGDFHSAFFIGSGKIENKMKYMYYIEQDGYFKFEQVDCEKAKIKYYEGDPKIEKISQEKIEGAFINNFCILFNPCEEYIFYIPEGSIQNNYSLDAQ